MKKKKFAVIGSTLGAVLIAGFLAVPAFAASDPADDVSTYSYTTGHQENAGRQAIYEELPENATDDELAAFYESHDVGGTSAYVNGTCDEVVKGNYSFNQGHTSYLQWHSAFTED
ncbi:MAG: hypothetical protein ACI4BB_02220 [Coprococcus sp.]